MRYQRGVGIFAAVAVVAVTAAVSAHAGPTRPGRASGNANVVDHTYSCRVRAQHYVDVDASVTLPPAQDQPRPATLSLFTVEKTIKRNGLDFNVPQLFFQAAKGSPKIDRSTCARSSRRVALKPAGLPGPQTVTPAYLGSLDERCTTTRRVLLHVRITLQNGTPTAALVAIRNDTKTRLAVESLNWRPRKIKGYFGKSCVSLSTG